ncbi:MAG: response regulator [Firmicutes bacterium]|jgi:CheY-like chemotaxis protein|nr:response regulator [Bacillota bacterium]
MNIEYPKAVLFVDDEPNIIKSLKRGLMVEDYDKFFALSGQEALEILEANTISVIVTDMKMPGMNGLDLLKIVREKYPDTVRIVLSGYTHLPQVLVTINNGEIFRFITKPWKMDGDFKKIIWDAIEHYGSSYENIKLKEELTKKNQLYQSLIKSSDEKIEKMKKQMEAVKKISEEYYRFFDEIDEKFQNGQMSEKDFWKNMKYMKDFNYMVIRSMPPEMKNFEVSKLVDSLNKETVVKSGGSYQIEYNSATKSHRGYYDLYYNIISKFIEKVIDKLSSNIRMAVIEDGENKYIVVVAAVVSDFLLDRYFIDNVIVILKEMLGIIITLTEKDKKYSLLIQLP